MSVTSRKVVAGKTEVPGESFPEDQAVTVPAPEGDEIFSLCLAEEAALLEVMVEGDRGDVVSAEGSFQSLGRSHGLARSELASSLQRVLPSGFVRIRNYGPLANRCRAEALKLCR